MKQAGHVGADRMARCSRYLLLPDNPSQQTMHPLDLFRFCPVCGSAHFVVNNIKSKRCESCGFIYYMNPSAATVAFIVNDRHELLTVRRRNEPARGTLDLPGGFSDMDETSEQGVVREVLEETGLHVEQTDFLFSLPNDYVYSGLPIPTMDMFYLCKVSDFSALHAADDAEACLFVPIDKLCPDDFGLTSVRKGIARFMSMYGNGSVKR